MQKCYLSEQVLPISAGECGAVVFILVFFSLAECHPVFSFYNMLYVNHPTAMRVCMLYHLGENGVCVCPQQPLPACVCISGNRCPPM